ncbi:type II toxin-antitoxin system HigB family toxin [Pantoea agglomerans]|uniref:type II toxin-antitoxin system HigB family toxin n=1 Tax=Enterobacter agglomerans TaxID=549 RepID=UPI00117DB6C1|nr:type II toxin-antitoxin system HigB family toxin [Pantoea agglomerans]NKE96877.1 type II toxin-antitoxin system HigB family toxin [Pantoea agglomerans]TRO72182.1 type II toxin-antitoxin system HigB family toxin [Pantoea agglomerans]
MRIILIASLKRFWEAHNQAEQPLRLRAWVDEVSKAQWKTPQDIKDKYRTADFLSSNRVVFDIKGNHYRLIVAVAYRFQAVYIKFVGTHAEYDKINANTVEM